MAASAAAAQSGVAFAGGMFSSKMSKEEDARTQSPDRPTACNDGPHNSVVHCPSPPTRWPFANILLQRCNLPRDGGLGLTSWSRCSDLDRLPARSGKPCRTDWAAASLGVDSYCFIRISAVTIQNSVVHCSRSNVHPATTAEASFVCPNCSRFMA